MKISATKLTTPDLARIACQYTMHSHAASAITMDRLYAMEHSPIRTQLFAVEMVGIPTFVSVHLTRHKIGVEHWVQTNREDRLKKSDDSLGNYKGLTAEYFKERFAYKDGRLFWKSHRRPGLIGKEAGDIHRKKDSTSQYTRVRIDGESLCRHVVVFMMHHGHRPHIVDHINGDKVDDRIENLRPASRSQNNTNSKPYTDTGLKGVSFWGKKFRATISLDGAKKHIGMFDTAEEAARAYDDEALRYFGEFAYFNFRDKSVHRWIPVNHLMIANAQALINMARKRLCHKASPETRDVMEKIRTAIGGVDPALGNVMVPECYYRGFICHERAMCGQMANVKHYLETWAWYGE